MTTDMMISSSVFFHCFFKHKTAYELRISDCSSDVCSSDLNCFLSQMRRKKFTADYDEIAAERLLVAPDAQDDSLHLADVQRALMMLPVDQREALVLIGAGGLSYEEGAAICGCAVGTMKSRVSRARAALQDILEGGEMPLRSEDELPASDAFAAIMGKVDDLTANGPAGD